MRHLFLLFVCTVFFTQAFSQGQADNLEKYWLYRSRLTTDFMVVGDAQGMSMPAERIDTVAKSMHWADNTIWLGWYIGTLALEYHLLTNGRYSGYGLNDTTTVQQTLDELYYALQGLIRLDKNAEVAFPLPCDSLPDMRNGFFLRDDVPDDFYTYFPGMMTAHSDYNAAAAYNKEMSQDQVYHVLFGLAMVKKFIPATIVVKGMSLRDEAVNEALLICDWVHRDGWVIKNPACQNKSVARGPDAFLLSHGLNEAVKFFSDGTVSYDADVTAVYTLTWNSLTSPSNPGYTNINNLHMAMVIAAIGRGWDSNTLDALMTLAVSQKWYVYPLAYIALFDDTAAPQYYAWRDTFNYWTEAMLDEAPPEGPYTLYPDSNNHGYAVNNRFIRPRSLHYTGNQWTQNNQFTGLDYMMLHNLYYTVTPAKWPQPLGMGTTTATDESLRVYPNPAGNTLYIDARELDGKEYTLRIFNVLGEMIDGTAITVSAELKADVFGFPPGLYWLQLTGDDGRHYTARFVKE